jgi:drug/metabolite transporter (DMT)-like permease
MAVFAHAASATMPSQHVLFWRSIVSLVMIAPFAYQHLPAILRHPVHHGGLWLRSGVSAVSVCILFLNIAHLGAAPASLLIDTSLVMIVLYRVLIQRLPLHLWQWVALGLVLLGNVALQLPSVAATSSSAGLGSHQQALWGLGLVGAALAAVSFVQLNTLSVRYPSSTILLAYLIAIIPCALVPQQVWLPALTSGHSAWAWPTLAQAGLLLGLGLASTANQLTLTACYKRLTASMAGMVVMTGVVWAGLWDALLLGVRFSPEELACYAVILSGLAVLKAVKPTHLVNTAR